MIEFAPIEGNGWYVRGIRVLPPPQFYAEVASITHDYLIEGVVRDDKSDFDGYRFLASPRYADDKTWLTIRLDKSESGIDRNSVHYVYGSALIVGKDGEIIDISKNIELR
jgi:hypothetical protein